MTKEALDRIKEAYYSGLKVQIWFDGHWENFDARDYSMYPEPFSENRQYRIVGSDYADMAEKRLADLEKQIADLEWQLQEVAKDNDNYQKENAKLKKRNGELAGQKASLERWFVEAKDLLDKVLRVVHSELNPYQMQPYLEVLKQAEQFLSESEPQLDLACQGFKDGYNKANEWHYVKDGDLPKDFGYYLVALKSIAYKGFVFEVVYFTGSIFTKEGEISDNVYAWKEIVLPSEPMRSLNKEEQKNYTEAINKVYKPTGVKLFDKE